MKHAHHTTDDPQSNTPRIRAPGGPSAGTSLTHRKVAGRAPAHRPAPRRPRVFRRPRPPPPPDWGRQSAGWGPLRARGGGAPAEAPNNPHITDLGRAGNPATPGPDSTLPPEVGPPFSAKLLNIGGGGVGLLIGRDETSAA